MKKISTVLIVISLGIFTGVLGLLVWWQQIELQSTRVIFLNVGQGDAILIQQGRHQVLIDSGKSGPQLLTELGRYVPFWDRHIEIIILTHPDADHVGGFASLAHGYSLGRVFWTGVESDTEVFKQFRTKLSRVVPEDRWHKVAAGSRFTLPLGGTAEMLYPPQTFNGTAKDEDTNATSIVTRFQYGETTFLFTGDLANEEFVLSDVQPVTVLQAAHHGSKFSTSEIFLGLTDPAEVVISVGKNNYGHPTKEVLDRIEKSGAKTLRTDQEGSIEYRCPQEQNKCIYVGRRVF